jgi:hypothetical protein
MSQNKKFMLELAVKSCEKALELNPNNTDTLNLLATSIVSQGPREGRCIQKKASAPERACGGI